MTDLINSLPSDPALRKKILNNVNELVQLKLQIKDLQSQIKDIKDVAKEDNGIDPTWLVFMADLEYDRLYDAEKKRSKLEEAVEKATELDILFGREG